MSRIALALIKQLVANGQLDAADVAAMCEELSERDGHNVKVAWIEALAGPDEESPPKPRLGVIEGGRGAKSTADRRDDQAPWNSER